LKREERVVDAGVGTGDSVVTCHLHEMLAESVRQGDEEKVPGEHNETVKF